MLQSLSRHLNELLKIAYPFQESEVLSNLGQTQDGEWEGQHWSGDSIVK